ncbi:MAG: hypothetical protein JSS53_00135 [Proteobacteria bacterium]|nr:hypothetical protein [Pseudomonadota bacterium]
MITLTFEKLGISNKMGMMYLIALSRYAARFFPGDNDFFEFEKHGWVLEENPLTKVPEFVSRFTLNMQPSVDTSTDALFFNVIEEAGRKFRVVVSLPRLVEWYNKSAVLPVQIIDRLQKFPTLLEHAVAFFNHFIFPEFALNFADNFQRTKVSGPVFCKAVAIKPPAFSKVATARLPEPVSGDHMYVTMPRLAFTQSPPPPSPSLPFTFPKTDSNFNPLQLMTPQSRGSSLDSIDGVRLSLSSDEKEKPYFINLEDQSYLSFSAEEVENAYVNLFVALGIKFTVSSVESKRREFLIDPMDLISFYQKCINDEQHLNGNVGIACDAAYAVKFLLAYCNLSSNTDYVLRISSSNLSRPGYLAITSINGTSSLIFCDYLRNTCVEAKKNADSLSFVPSSSIYRSWNEFFAYLTPAFPGSVVHAYDHIQFFNIQNEILKKLIEMESCSTIQTKLLECFREQLQGFWAALTTKQRTDFSGKLRMNFSQMSIFGENDNARGIVEPYKVWAENLHTSATAISGVINNEGERIELSTFIKNLQELLKTNDKASAGAMLKLQKIVVDFLTSCREKDVIFTVSEIDKLVQNTSEINIQSSGKSPFNLFKKSH